MAGMELPDASIAGTGLADRPLAEISSCKEEINPVIASKECKTPTEVENVATSQGNLNTVNIMVNKFVLNKKQIVKKKLAQMDGDFVIIPRDVNRQFKFEMSTPTYHILIENILNLGCKYGHKIEREDVDEEGEKLRRQFNIDLCAAGGKTIPITLTCYHTNNSMLIQLKKSEHSITERIRMLVAFIENTVKRIIEEVESSSQHGYVKELLRSQLLGEQQKQHSLEEIGFQCL